MNSSLEDRLTAYYDDLTADLPDEGPGLDTVGIVRLTLGGPPGHRTVGKLIVVGAAAAAGVLGLVVLTQRPTADHTASTPTDSAPTTAMIATTDASVTTPTTDAVVTTPTTVASASCTSDALLAAVVAMYPEELSWNPTSVNVKKCRSGYAEIVVIFDQSSCPTPGVACHDNGLAWLHDQNGAWTMLDVGTGIGCDPGDSVSPGIVDACAALAVDPSSPVAVTGQRIGDVPASGSPPWMEDGEINRDNLPAWGTVASGGRIVGYLKPFDLLLGESDDVTIYGEVGQPIGEFVDGKPVIIADAASRPSTG